MKRILILLIIFGSLLSCDDLKNHIRDGNSKYNQGKFNEAEVDYLKALSIDSTNQKAAFNLGNTLYHQKDASSYEKAEKYFDQAMLRNDDSNMIQHALYNKGNTLLQQLLEDSSSFTSMLSKDHLEKTIESYKQALRLNPEDEDARYNLAYALWLQQKNDDNQDSKSQENQQQVSAAILEALKRNELKTLQRLSKEQQPPKNREIEKDW